MLRQGTVERPGGRHVAWASWGDPAGRPLLMLHGTPGSRLNRSSDPDLYERVGAQVVTFDRPGYGRSSPQRDRTIVSVADDAVAVADAMGWSRFSVLGVSGGGPHALALGVRAPERIAALGVAVGMLPIEMVDPEAMIAHNREAFRRARDEGRSSLEEFLAEPASQIADDPMGVIDALMADAPPVDLEMLRRPDLRAVLAEAISEGFANGPAGWFDDSWALSRPWGFAPSDVTVPVSMWYGALDRNVPIGALHAFASELQLDSLEVIPGAGHLGWLAREDDVLLALLR